MSRKVIQICIFKDFLIFSLLSHCFTSTCFFFFFTFLQRVQELPLPLWAATVSINASLGYQVISASVFTLVHVEIHMYAHGSWAGKMCGFYFHFHILYITCEDALPSPTDNLNASDFIASVWIIYSCSRAVIPHNKKEVDSLLLFEHAGWQHWRRTEGQRAAWNGSSPLTMSKKR